MALFVTVHVADGLSMRSGSNMVIPRGINVNHRPEHAELENTVLLRGGICWNHQYKVCVYGCVCVCARARVFVRARSHERLRTVFVLVLVTRSSFSFKRMRIYFFALLHVHREWQPSFTPCACVFANVRVDEYDLSLRDTNPHSQHMCAGPKYFF